MGFAHAHEKNDYGCVGRVSRPDRSVNGSGDPFYVCNPHQKHTQRRKGDYEALEQILAEGLTRYACRILAYQLMPNHWHFVLQPTEDGGMSNFLRWVSLTLTMRLRAHYRTGGQGHVYQGRFKSFPIRG